MSILIVTTVLYQISLGSCLIPASCITLRPTKTYSRSYITLCIIRYHHHITQIFLYQAARGEGAACTPTGYTSDYILWRNYSVLYNIQY